MVVREDVVVVVTIVSSVVVERMREYECSSTIETYK